jgi:hypothetical protein
MDRRRDDVAGQALEPVPTPASTTTAQLAKRFTATHLAGIEAGIGELNSRLVTLLPEHRRLHLLAVATIDGDTTDVEVYGRHKQDVVHNYQGQLAYRPHIAFWAEGGTPVAADLMRADEDPRPAAADLLDRAIGRCHPGWRRSSAGGTRGISQRTWRSTAWNGESTSRSASNATPRSCGPAGPRPPTAGTR